jgi:DNA-directed RNA polymerase sigma subunit (sigma70/sigma32)
LSEEWLLKRIPFLLGREKVTPTVKDELEKALTKLSGEGIIRRNGFIYLDGEEISMLRIPKENDDEKRELLIKSKNGDKKAREELIDGNLRLVLSIIQRFTSRRENLDDLFRSVALG